MKQQSLTGTWQLRQADHSTWMPGPVPGDVHTALLAVGKIPDPFFGDNEKRVMWVAESDWEYRRAFTPDSDLLAEEKVFLVCDGLDTLAQVILNGQVVGSGENMFRQYEWEVKSMLKNGENELRVLFGSPVNYITPRQAENPMVYGGDIPGGPHLRKAPCQWGWDWGPKLPPIGIWKDIRLVGHSAARYEDVHLRQHLEGDKGVLSASVKIEQWDKTPVQVGMKVTAPDGKVLQASAEGSVDGLVKVDVAKPQIWWPNGYGAQPLYDVEVTLLAGGKVLDTRQYKVGFRTIELRREPDQWGESFTFFVNGVPVFAKGADWIPADSFPTRISDAYLEGLIRSAVQANMNMLRIWGGGLYEEERFYDLCDRYGVLVWQDFIFACGTYPANDAFFTNVRVEAVQNVRRLRHRTCLALWCGNNEMEQGWSDWGYNRPGDHVRTQIKAGYDRMFHHMLPDIVHAEDPDRTYWPSSASSGIPFFEPNSQDRGDCHYWDVWHGRKPFTAYRSQYPRFMSEFGFQALPPFETIKTYAEPKDWNMTSYIMEHHQRSGSGNGLMIGQMTDTFRMPKGFPELVYLSMILQAEGIRYGVEHWRRSRERVSGTLIWQLNDCWPVASWASLDYFGRWKALHYAAKRFYEPVMMSIEDDGKRMGVHVTSDLVAPWQGSILWRLETLSGEIIASGEAAVKAKALADTLVTALDFSDRITDENRRQVVFTCELWHGDRLLVSKMGTFCPNKHLELVEPELKASLSEDKGQLKVSVSAASLARFVELKFEGSDVVFSDNYFDVSAGKSVEVTCPLPTGMTLDLARKALRITSLYHSYA